VVRQQITAVEITSAGETESVKGTHFISSMPSRQLIEKLDPAVPAEVLQAARNLKYRDFLTVALIVNQREVFRITGYMFTIQGQDG